MKPLFSIISLTPLILISESYEEDDFEQAIFKCEICDIHFTSIAKKATHEKFSVSFLFYFTIPKQSNIQFLNVFTGYSCPEIISI